MVANRFDNLLRSLAASPSRRSIGRGMAGLALGGPLSALFIPEDAEAKKKKRKKKKKKCAKAGQAPKKKKRCCRELIEDLTGRCARPCTPTSCAATSLCVERICQPCDVCQPAGACAYDSVQAAINADDLFPTTIRICPGVYVGDLDITRSLTLIGAGDGISDGADTILEGTGTRSVVIIGTEIGDAEVMFQRLRIRGGSALNGGGILNLDDLTLTDCTISGNTALDWGGGILNDLGTVTLTNSSVIGNRVSDAGGGIFNARGTVTLDAASRVMFNEANPTFPRGGGIYNDNGSVTLGSPDNVSDNTPDQCGGNAVPLCSG